MIAMDAQGSELKILKGFGDKLKKVNFIITECTFNSGLIGGTNFKEIDSYLQTTILKQILNKILINSLNENYRYLQFN